MRREVETKRYDTEGNAARQLQAMPAMPDYREERKRREEQERQDALKRKKRAGAKNLALNSCKIGGKIWQKSKKRLKA